MSEEIQFSVWRGFLAEIRVLPMSVAIGTTIMGAAFAAGSAVRWGILLLVVLNAFCFLYAAHINDTFWDVRTGEYVPGQQFHTTIPATTEKEIFIPRWGFGTEVSNAPILAPRYYVAGVLVTIGIGSVLALLIGSIVGWGYLALSFGGLLLALTYSAGLDKITVLGDVMWEVGIILCLFCGFYSMAGTIVPSVVQMAIGLFIALVGVKMLDAWYDLDIDLKRNKMTFPVFLVKRFNMKREHIRDLGYGLIYTTLILLMVQLPPLFYPGILGGVVLIGGSHLYYRGKDHIARIGVSWVAIGIMVFILWNIFIFLQG